MSSAIPTSSSTSRCSTPTGIRASGSIAIVEPRARSARRGGCRLHVVVHAGTIRRGAMRPVHAVCSPSRCRPTRSSTRSAADRPRGRIRQHALRAVGAPTVAGARSRAHPARERGRAVPRPGNAQPRHRDRALGQREHGEDAFEVDLPEDVGRVARRSDRAHLRDASFSPKRHEHRGTTRSAKRRSSRANAPSDASDGDGPDSGMLVFGARSEQDRGPMKTTRAVRTRTRVDRLRAGVVAARFPQGCRDPRALRDLGEQLLPGACTGSIDRPEAMAYDPLTVLRLRKRREQARRDRIEGRRADPGTR